MAQPSKETVSTQAGLHHALGPCHPCKTSENACLHKVLRGLMAVFACQAARSEASAAAAAQMEAAARSQEQLEGHLAVLRATAADCQVPASCSRLYPSRLREI